MLNLSDNPINRLLLGDSEVRKMYLGDRLAYEVGGGMTLEEFRALSIGAWAPGIASTMLNGEGNPCGWNEEIAVLQNSGNRWDNGHPLLHNLKAWWGNGGLTDMHGGNAHTGSKLQYTNYGDPFGGNLAMGCNSGQQFTSDGNGIVDMTKPHTAARLVYWDGNVASLGIFYTNSSTNQSKIIFQNSPRLLFQNWGGLTNPMSQWTGSLLVGWNSIVMTYNGTNLQCYVNGTLVRSEPETFSVTSGNLGGWNCFRTGSGVRFMNGAVYDRHWTQDDVDLYHNGGSFVQYADLEQPVPNPNSATDAIQVTANNQPFALPAEEPTYYGSGDLGNEIDPNKSLNTGTGEFEIRFNCILTSTSFYIMGDSGGNFSYGMRFNGSLFEMGTADFSLSRPPTLNQRIELRIRRLSNNYILIEERPNEGSWETLHSAGYGSTRFIPDIFLGKGSISTSIATFTGACFSFFYSAGGSTLVDMKASDFGHLETTGTDAIGTNLTIIQSGNNPALALHHSCARSNGQSLLTALFESPQTEGRLIVVFYDLSDSGDPSARIASLNTGSGGDGSGGGWAPCSTLISTRDLTSFFNSATRTTVASPVDLKVIYDIVADPSRYEVRMNGASPVSATVDISSMNFDQISFFNRIFSNLPSSIILHEALWFPTTVTDEQIAEGIAALSAEYDFPLTS